MINAKLLEKERMRALTTKVTAGLSERVQGGGGGGIENCSHKNAGIRRTVKCRY